MQGGGDSKPPLIKNEDCLDLESVIVGQGTQYVLLIIRDMWALVEEVCLNHENDVGVTSDSLYKRETCRTPGLLVYIIIYRIVY